MKPVTFPMMSCARWSWASTSSARTGLNELLGGNGLAALRLRLRDRLARLLECLGVAGRCGLRSHLGECALVFVREHLHELGARLGPVIEDVARAQRAGPLVVV